MIGHGDTVHRPIGGVDVMRYHGKRVALRWVSDAETNGGGLVRPRRGSLYSTSHRTSFDDFALFVIFLLISNKICSVD